MLCKECTWSRVMPAFEVGLSVTGLKSMYMYTLGETHMMWTDFDWLEGS